MNKPILILLFSATIATACGGTPEERIGFDVAVRGVGRADLPNEHGWTVTLEEARLHVAAVYFFEGEPVFGGRSARAWAEALAWAVLGVGVAHAHPGHYAPGAALAEMIAPRTIDLLAATPAVIGRADGVTGAYRSARIDLAAEDGVTASLRGMARSGTVTVAFSAEVATSLELEGLSFRHDVGPRAGVATVEVLLDTWIDRVDFSEVVAEPGPVLLAPGSRAHNALTRGIEDLAGYRFVWEES